MSNKLHDLITRQIELNGPISIATYMDLCLGHPEFGYYRSRDPLGIAGDFTTAPEISQLFGEMIGICIADLLMRMGNPQNIILCELGPGRGTLMSDVLRVLGKVPNVNIEVHLVETSEVLKQKQKEALGNVHWHASLDTLPTHAPVIFIANEFLDALPLRQVVKTRNGWQEGVVGLKDGKLVLGLGSVVNGVDLPEAKDGTIFEFSPAREAIWQEICTRIGNQKGAAFVIDYGHLETKTGNTFQAVKDHSFANPLENPGEQDLTSHVDFAKLGQLAKNLQIDYFTTQGEFLKNMGIEVRAEHLSAANPSQRDSLMVGLKRLIHRDEMGILFKVIGVSNL